MKNFENDLFGHDIFSLLKKENGSSTFFMRIPLFYAGFVTLQFPCILLLAVYIIIITMITIIITIINTMVLLDTVYISPTGPVRNDEFCAFSNSAVL